MKTLHDVQPGDQVLYRTNCYAKIIKVDRVTPTLIVCNNNKFRKDDGRKVPHERWNSCSIEVLTDDLKHQFYTEVKRQKLIANIKLIDWNKLSLESLSEIFALASNEK